MNGADEEMEHETARSRMEALIAAMRRPKVDGADGGRREGDGAEENDDRLAEVEQWLRRVDSGEEPRLSPVEHRPHAAARRYPQASRYSANRSAISSLRCPNASTA
jgi:hypothetical protein